MGALEASFWPKKKLIAGDMDLWRLCALALCLATFKVYPTPPAQAACKGADEGSQPGRADRQGAWKGATLPLPLE